MRVRRSGRSGARIHQLPQLCWSFRSVAGVPPCARHWAGHCGSSREHRRSLDPRSSQPSGEGKRSKSLHTIDGMVSGVPCAAGEKFEGDWRLERGKCLLWGVGWGETMRPGRLRAPWHRGGLLSRAVGGVLGAEERGYLRGRELLRHLHDGGQENPGWCDSSDST